MSEIRQKLEEFGTPLKRWDDRLDQIEDHLEGKYHLHRLGG